MTKLITILCFAFISSGCAYETVSPGHKGVQVSWAGETNMKRVYSEGYHGGMHWLIDDMVEYDCREQTAVAKFHFNDANNMVTGVEIAVDYSNDPDRVNLLHTKISDVKTKMEKTIKSAGKEVVPSYAAVDLNLTKRGEAEERLAEILSDEFPEFFLLLKRVQITDVDIPSVISEQAMRTAEQIEKNKLAAEMAEEKTNLGHAIVAEAKAKAEAARYEAEAAKMLSTPEIIKLREIEGEALWAQSGNSKYGSHNMFGTANAFKLVK